MTPAERIAELRRRQAESAPGPGRSAVEFMAEFLEGLQAHDDHPWEQVGRCVYCVPCGERLYQGTIPEGHPVGRRQSKPPRNMLAEFRERWGQP